MRPSTQFTCTSILGRSSLFHQALLFLDTTDILSNTDRLKEIMALRFWCHGGVNEYKRVKQLGMQAVSQGVVGPPLFCGNMLKELMRLCQSPPVKGRNVCDDSFK